MKQEIHSRKYPGQVYTVEPYGDDSFQAVMSAPIADKSLVFEFEWAAWEHIEEIRVEENDAEDN